METITDRNLYTIEHVIKTAERTLEEYENTSDRLGSDRKALRPVGRNLNLVKDRLELIVGVEEDQGQLDEITVGSEATPFLEQLDLDLSSICTYLQNATSPLREAEVDGYVQTMGRYAEVLKVVLSRNKMLVERVSHCLDVLMMVPRNIMQRIEAEVSVLNYALARMKDLLSHSNEPSDHELHGTLRMHLSQSKSHKIIS
jgi:hypothetical protein